VPVMSIDTEHSGAALMVYGAGKWA